jgi:hypothetical protein
MIIAFRDGLRDARLGRAPYFWTILADSARRGPRLREGLRATARIILLGFAMDAVYQFIAFRAFYPVEAIIVVFTLAFLPYLILRGPVDRLARWWHHRQTSRPPTAPKGQDA